MQLLLDTHALIWWLANNPTHSNTAKNAIADPDNLVFVSAASAWEIAIKKSIRKLQTPDDLAMQIEAKDFIPDCDRLFAELFNLKKILAINLHIHVSLVIVVKTGKSHII